MGTARASSHAGRAATYKRPHGVRHLISAYDRRRDRLYGHVKHARPASSSSPSCRYIRSLYPPTSGCIVLDNFSPHLDRGPSRDWAAANNVELAYTPFYACC